MARIVTTLLIKKAVLLSIYLQATSSITLASICSVIESDIDWMHEIVKYLQTRELPGYEKHARKIQV